MNTPPEDLSVAYPAQPLSQTKTSTASPEWLDANRWAVFSLLAAIPFLVTVPLWIFGLSPDPIWFFSEFVRNVKPGLLPSGLPFGDPNVGWTSQALGHLAASQWIHGKVPWWNPYSGIGLPLAGEMQPGAFFLPFILLLLFHNGFIWLRISMQLVAGFSTFFLLRELKLGRLAALLGGALFELNGTFAWTPGPVSTFCAAAFLPLILLGVEQISNRRRARLGTICVALGIAFSLLAGFPEIAYIDGLLVLLWAFCRFAKQQRRWRFLLRVIWSTLLAVLLAAPLLVAFWSLSKESSGFQLHQLGHLSLPREAFPIIFLPYVYGPFPAAHGNSILLGIWGNVGGYIGITILLFALLGLQSRKPLWIRILLIAWVALAWAKTFGVKPVMELVNDVPFLLQAAFYRYAAPSWELCLIILAAFALDEWRHRKLRLIIPVLVSLAVFAWCIYLVWPGHASWGWDPAHQKKMMKFLACALVWALSGLGCAILILRGPRTGKRHWVLAGILVVDAAAFFTVPFLSSSRPGSVDRAGVRFLRTHLGLSRFYSLEPMEPNYNAYFQVPAINYDSFPVPQNFLNHIEQQVFPPLVKSAGAIFWPAWQPYGEDAGSRYLQKFLTNYEALGVRFVIGNSTGAGTLLLRVALPTAETNMAPLPLQPNEHVQLSVPAPVTPKHSSGSIQAFSLLIGTYTNSSDGALAVKICAAGQCAQGSRSLAESSGLSFSIPLTSPLKATAGDKFQITVTHEGGTKPVALWLWPDLPGHNQHLSGPNGNLIPGKAVRIAFGYDNSSVRLPTVYHDSLVDIFKLPDPAPFYSIVSGGPCRLAPKKRDSLEVSCAAPAVLIRRELYMPGWHASWNSTRLEAKPYHEIFQCFDLPQGDAYLRFSYVPPHTTLAALGTLFAALALVAEFLPAFRRQGA